MLLRRGDLMHVQGVRFFTANSYVRKDGALAMGAGLAKQVKKQFPALPKYFGQKIPHLGCYHLIAPHPVYLWGALQTKVHWRSNSPLSLVHESINALHEYAVSHTGRIYVNMPGVGLGGLDWDTVYPIVETLPDNVTVMYL